MFVIVRKTLCVLLLVFVAAAPLGCLSINGPEKPETDVNVGGEHGVNVHDGGKSDNK